MVDEKTLTEEESRLWKYIQEHDFEGGPWSTPVASRDLGFEEDVVYQALSGLGKKLKDDMYIYYKDGAIRIATERKAPKRKK